MDSLAELNSPLAYNDMQMRLPLLPRRLNPRLQHVLRLLHIQPMQVYRVIRHMRITIIRPEDKVPRLLVVLVHLRGVLLALLRELVRSGAIAGFVGLLGAIEAGVALGGFLVGEVPETVVLLLGGGVGAMVEGWVGMLVVCFAFMTR